MSAHTPGPWRYCKTNGSPTHGERIDAWRRKYQRVPVHPYGSDLIDLTDPNEPDIPCFEGAPGTTYTEEF